MNQNNKKGFSLIEMLLVIGVLAVLLIGAFVVYPRVKNSINISNESKNLTLISAGLINYFESKGGDYSSLSGSGGNAFANRARIIPARMNNGNYDSTEIKNTWGGDVLIGASNFAHTGYGAGRNFFIRYQKVPSEACVGLISEVASLFTNIQIEGIGSPLKDNQLDISALTVACQASETSTLTFISK